VPDAAELVEFYERAYSHEHEDALRYGRWRALGALGKADHVIALCERAGVRPRSTLEVGCGDGALLCELRARGFGGRLTGAEITESGARLARAREQIDSVCVYDGARLPMGDREHDLGVLSHVLEHVADPSALLAEVARVCDAVVLEVPLEANLSARRASKREQAADVGHLQRLDRAGARRIVAGAGLRIAYELEDALPLRVHLFFAQKRTARALARIKWAVRASLHRLAPALARRLFSVHYACLCVGRSLSTSPAERTARSP
jgi:SAM-dependent methyltransferase